MASSKLEVRLVNPVNHDIVFERAEFSLVKGRLPLQEIMNKWGLKNPPIWIDAEIDLGLTKDGLSDIAFNNMKIVKLVKKE